MILFVFVFVASSRHRLAFYWAFAKQQSQIATQYDSLPFLFLIKSHFPRWNINLKSFRIDNLGLFALALKSNFQLRNARDIHNIFQNWPPQQIVIQATFTFTTDIIFIVHQLKQATSTSGEKKKKNLLWGVAYFGYIC